MSDWPEIELIVQQQLRMSRLRASTSLSGTPLNLFLMEYTPSQRVLSGEIIVFQNEMIDMFQELIDKLESEKQVTMSDLAFDTSKKQGSKVPNKKVRYLSSVILEFFRSLVEN